VPLFLTKFSMTSEAWGQADQGARGSPGSVRPAAGGRRGQAAWVLVRLWRPRRLCPGRGARQHRGGDRAGDRGRQRRVQLPVDDGAGDGRGDAGRAGQGAAHRLPCPRRLNDSAACIGAALGCLAGWTALAPNRGIEQWVAYVATVALRELSGRSPDVRPTAGKRCLAGHSLTAVVRY
jgi:hypothetical protein